MPRDGTPARVRLREAALALYAERGYDRTTAAQIAGRAGVSERTYFRHFADKREVLFDGEAELRTTLVDAVAAAPEGLAPLPVLARAFTAAVPLFVAGREIARCRAELIEVTPALHERAQAKAGALTDALADALCARAVAPPTAQLAARIGMATFDRAYRAWAEHPTANLGALIAEATDEVAALNG